VTDVGADSATMQLQVEVEQAWPEILNRLTEQLDQPEQVRKARIWLGSPKVRPAGVENGILILECPTALFQAQIREKFSDSLASVAGRCLETAISGVLCRVTRHALRQHRQRLEEQRTVQDAAPSPRGGRPSFGQGFKLLEDFGVGSCNRLAFDSVNRILDGSSNAVNPLFIHGSSGLGKTHLEQGLALAFKERFSRCKVLYMSCEQFRNAYLSACEGGTSGLQAFRVRLRHADLLLIDDIHFLSRGQMERTKEELFSTFNELSERGKKIVITSDAHPSDIKYLEERFVQRFTGGLVVALDRPDPQTRREVVAAKARSHEVAIPEEVIDFVADHITDNMRELEGAVNKIVAYGTSFGRSIDLQLTRQALSDLIQRDASEPRLKIILRQVADYFDLSVDDLLGKSRSGSRSTARHIAMYVLKSSGSDTYAAVGQAFGIKSHSSVAYACEQVARYRATDPEIDRFVQDLLMRLRRR
jgi:chromosomal replication initiator protein